MGRTSGHRAVGTRAGFGAGTWSSLAWCFVMAAACVVAASGSAAAETTIRVFGSDTMVVLNRELTARYAESAAEVDFTVLGGGSETGIRALMEGRTDIAAASRRMKEAELDAFAEKTGERPMELVVALDGIGVYVHDNNPITRLTVDELVKILAGEITNWKTVRGVDRRIDIYNRNKDSGTRTYMQSHLLGGKSFSKRAMDVSSTALITACVSRNQSAIGYGGIAYAENTRIIRLASGPKDAGVWPTRENVRSGKYPLSRPLYYYINPASMSEALRGYIDWVLSEEGQKVVTFVGYYPAPDAPDAADAADDGAGNGAGQEQREPAAPEPAASDGDDEAASEAGPTVLTPDNMKQHGFDLRVETTGGDEAAPGRAPVEVRFGPNGRTVDNFVDFELHLGKDAIIPLSPAEGIIRFSLRRDAIDQTAVHLAEADENGEANDKAFIIPLKAFVGEGD